MYDILNMVIALIISTVIINVLMNFNNTKRIDFVGFLEYLWKKIKGAYR